MTKSKREIIISLTLTLAIILILIPIFKNQNNKVTASQIPEGFEEITIQIQDGDRAWNIQDRLTPNEDVRELLHYVSKINGKSVGELKVGEEITFLQCSK